MQWWHVGEVEVQLQLFLTLALDGDECSTSYPNHYNPGGKPQSPFNRRLLDPTAGLDIL